MQIISSLFYENTEAFENEWKALQQSGCDWIEVRLDRFYPAHPLLLLNQRLKALAAESRKPLLFTMRTDQDPSLCTPEQYRFLLRILDRNGWVYDVEYNRLDELDFSPDFSRVFLSYHHYTPDWSRKQMARIAQRISEMNPKVVKLALSTESFDQVLSVISIGEGLLTASEKCFIAMEEIGLVSRLIPQFFGFDYTFCANGQATASGQITLEQMENFQKLLAAENAKSKG